MPFDFILKTAQPSCATLTQGAPRALGRGKAKSTASLLKKSGVFAIALASSFFSFSSAHAATPESTVVNNTAYVSFDFNGQNRQVQDSESFITARTSAGSGTPSVITLMHNSVDFTTQYAEAKAREDAANGSSNLMRSRQNALTSGSTNSSNITTRASSSGQALAGDFVVNQGQCASDASGKTLSPQPIPKNYQGQTLSLPSTLALNSDDYYKVGDTIFVHLKDLDQNQDPTQIEKIIVTILSENGVDQETIQLTETAVSSGLFTGYIQTVNSATNAPIKHNCALSVTSDSSIQASYQDKFDSLDLAKAGALFDPSSYVVNADTGEYVNGITVSLYDKDGVTPAEILSDEGGVFPNTVTTGGTVSVVGADSNTYTYTFPYGGFAFPVLDGGEYVIKIGESAYHDYPVADEKPLTDIPQGPFNFDEEGSRGKIFTSGITFRMDVPLDPKDNSVLLTKTANKAQAGVGELVSYNIKLQNTEIPGTNVALKDTLPQGFRYAPVLMALK